MPTQDMFCDGDQVSILCGFFVLKREKESFALIWLKHFWHHMGVSQMLVFLSNEVVTKVSLSRLEKISRTGFVWASSLLTIDADATSQTQTLPSSCVLPKTY